MANYELNKHINIAEGFQYSVNIEYDINNEDKVKGFIPTTASYDIIEEIMLSTHDSSTERARILIGAYGKGKSHMVLVLLSLLMSKNKSIFSNLLPKIKEYSTELYDYVNDYIDSNKKLLPIIIQGGRGTLTQAFLSAMQKTLDAEGLNDLMPDTHFGSAIDTIENWRSVYKETYESFSKMINQPASDFIAKLQRFDTATYSEFEKCYPKLTSGSVFNPFLGLNVVDLYTDVTKKLKSKGYNGIYVVYDEFSKYLEADITTIQSVDIRLLQDFAEKCNRSRENQMHIMLISHKDISNYIDKLPKQKVDGWRGVSERFKHIEIKNNFSQVYEIISTVINQDKDYFIKFFKENQAKFDDSMIIYKDSSVFNELEDGGINTVVYDCYPLHPISTFILPRLSEKVAQNERTLFTFLSSQNKNTLWAFINYAIKQFPILTPDYIYDYFEPLFKKEVYTSDTYVMWKLTTNILNKIDETSLGAKIVKTIALIYISDQFEKLAPTPETITNIFSNVATIGNITNTINDLKQKQYVIYQYKSNNYLKLKDSTGANVAEMITNIREKNKDIYNVKDIINEFNSENFMYPTRYNDDNEITRYFEVAFITSKDFFDVSDWKLKINNIEGNGVVYAIMSDSEDNRKAVIKKIQSITNHCDRILFIVPQICIDVSSDAVEYKAVQTLKHANLDDELIIQELDIYIDDNEKVLKTYIATFLMPELRKSEYYYMGKKEQIFRKTQISELLSVICSNIYSKTPIIKNEIINKDTINSNIVNYRNKVVTALLSNQLEENLGLTGFAPDVSIMRSVLINTGIIVDIETKPRIVIGQDRNNCYHNILLEIENFFKNANGTRFEVLYNILTKPEYHIGLKKGVIPVLVAAVLHSLKKYVVICKNGKEIEIGAELLNSINETPSEYTAYLENWDEEKSNYISRLEEIFSENVLIKEKEFNTFAYIVRAMQRWFISLPKYAKELTAVYMGNGRFDKLDKEKIKFSNQIKHTDINAREFLFDKIVGIYNLREFSAQVTDNIEATKKIFDNAKETLIKGLALDVRELFANNHSKQATLSSILKDWYDSLGENTQNYLFDNGENRILDLVKTVTNDEKTFIERLAKCIVGLRVDDWNDKNIKTFIDDLRKVKERIEKQSKLNKSNSATESHDTYKISFVNSNGIEETKSFGKAEYSNTAKLLLNSIEQAIDEMGQSISENEKRQVLMEILEKLCR